MVNLDALDDDDLQEFADHARGAGLIAWAENVFPLREALARERAVERMGWYSRHLLRARTLRKEGRIQHAIGHEQWADGLYKLLPHFARW